MIWSTSVPKQCSGLSTACLVHWSGGVVYDNSEWELSPGMREKMTTCQNLKAVQF